MENDARDEQTYAIIGAAMDVHGALGSGFLEAVYEEALKAEFRLRSIDFVSQQPIRIMYKDIVLPCQYKADLICFGSVLVELKALKNLAGIEGAQVIHYLKATGLKKGLLLNFGEPRLYYKRFVI